MENIKKIIVIEDDKDINELIAYNLRKEGFFVESAFDGIEAEIKVQKERFAIVILDIMLPGIDGFEICKKIKSDSQAFKTFVIVVSAKGNPQDKLYAHVLGADYYFTKPFNVAALVDAVKEINTMQDKQFTVKSK